MAQPTLSGLTLNLGSGGSDLLHDVVDSKIAQVVLVGYSTGDGTMNVAMADAGMPVQLQTGHADINVSLNGEAVVLGAGSAAIGKLAANDAVDIGDVTVNNAAGSGVYVQPGTSVVFPVSDNGASLTVDNAGTFAAQVDSLTGANFTAAEAAALPSVFAVVAGDDGSDVCPIQLTAAGLLKVTLSSETVSVQGRDADDAPPTGNPVLAAGRYQASFRMVEDGDVATFAVDTTGQLYVVNAGTFAVQASQSGTWNIGTVTSITSNVNIADGGNTITVDDGGSSLTIDGTVAATQSGTWDIGTIASTVTVDGTGTFATQVDSLSGANFSAAEAAALPSVFVVVAGDDGTDTHPLQTTAAGDLKVNDLPQTSGGLSMHKTISAASTNGTNVKASAGQVYSVQLFNTNSSPRYVKLYDKATAPTVGTDTPVKTLTVPGNSAGAGLVLNWDKGLVFSNGIGFGTTTGVADSDTGAVAANELVIDIDYK